MSKFHLALMSLFVLFGPLQAEVDPALLDRFHICTTSSRAHKNLDKLKESCRLHNIDLKVLGMGKPYPGNGTKYLHLLDYIEPLDDEDIVMLVDAFDVLVVTDKDKLLEKFLNTGARILISAELGCHPFKDLASQYPDSPTRFKYLCAGAWMGYVGDVKKWAQSLQPINPGISDQGQITKQYLSGEKFITLDHHCEVFLNLYYVKDVVIDEERGLVHFPETGTEPGVVHASGRVERFFVWDQVYEKLIQNKRRN